MGTEIQAPLNANHVSNRVGAFRDNIADVTSTDIGPGNSCSALIASRSLCNGRHGGNRHFPITCRPGNSAHDAFRLRSGES